jgi:hypothetical protein
VLALPVGAMVEAGTIAVLAVLVGAWLEGFSALGARAAMVRLTVRAWALRTGVLRGSALAMTAVAGPLLAIVGLAVGARRPAPGATTAGGGTPGAWRAPGATVTVGMGRFHWPRV